MELIWRCFLFLLWNSAEVLLTDNDSSLQSPSVVISKLRPGRPKVTPVAQVNSADAGTTWLSFESSNSLETRLRVSTECKIVCHTHSAGRLPLAHEVRLDLDCATVTNGPLTGQYSAWDRVVVLRGISPGDLQQLTERSAQMTTLSSSVEGEHQILVSAGATQCVCFLLKESIDPKPATCVVRLTRHIDSMLLLFLGFFLSLLAVRLSRSKTFFLTCGTLFGCMAPLVLVLILARVARQRLLQASLGVVSVASSAQDRTERKLASAAAEGNAMAARMLANYQESRQRTAAVLASSADATKAALTQHQQDVNLTKLLHELMEMLGALRSRFAMLLMALIILSLHILFYVWENINTVSTSSTFNTYVCLGAFTGLCAAYLYHPRYASNVRAPQRAEWAIRALGFALILSSAPGLVVALLLFFVTLLFDRLFLSTAA